MMNWPAPGTVVNPVDGNDARSRRGSSMSVLEQLARTTQPRLSRRTLLSVGSLAGCSALLPGSLRGEPVSTDGASFGRARHCILLFLTGGPPQHDTWDPKPEATDGIRGETTAIETNVPGIRFGHLFPRMATCADRLCLVRSVTHSDTVHTSAGYTLLTGMPHPAPNNPMGAKTVGPSPDDHPHLGAVLASVRTPRDGVPVFVSLPEVIKDAAVNEFPGQSAGFMGRRYDPLQIEYDARSGRLQLQDLLPPEGLAAIRMERRRTLLDEFDLWRRGSDRAAALSEFDIFRERAFSLLSSRTVRAALDQESEPAGVRARYGSHLFGQGCLLARRLVEAGVSLVTVYWHYEGPDDSPVWDTHWNNFSHLRNRLAPPSDQAIAALLDDLAGRGLLDETLVVCCGEFGRSPRINDMAGRDHWPHVQTAVLAGAGMPTGFVYGASDSEGAYPVDSAVTPADLAATVLHLLGVPADLHLTDMSGRPHKACTGSPVSFLIS